jgi:hypothetical protein
MYRFTSRVGRATLALALTAALSACVDEQDPIAPGQQVRPQAAVGDVYTVTNTGDSGLGSLRWALSHATGGETIRFDPALAGRTITLDSTLDLRYPVTIEGPADRGITISGGGRVRVFELNYQGTTTLKNLAITGGKAPSANSGGAMIGLGNIVLLHSVVYGNEAAGVSAIYAGDVTLVNSTVSGNTSTQAPPGIKYPAVLGDRIYMTNSTVAFNSGGGVGGGAGLTMSNSIISNNGLGSNCGGFSNSPTFQGTNISDDDSCGGPSDILIGDPQLAPLADNGGPTRTHALVVGSPAINAGTLCTVQEDQRYVARDAHCDLGAFEFIDFTSVTLTIDASASVNPNNGWAVVTGSIRCSRDAAFDLAVDLKQTQKTGRVSADVQAAGSTPVACTTTVGPWSVALAPSNGAFQVGSAQVSAQTVNAAPWVTPASATQAVKLFWGHK